MVRSPKKIRVGILGASGYTGAELVRLLHAHPGVELLALTAEKNAGQPLAAVFPQFHGLTLPLLQTIGATDFSSLDCVFAALPHGLTQDILRELPQHLRLIDLSADFRLTDPAAYAQWYGHSHRALALQQEAVYGLTEFYMERIKSARLVANPGCYPTAAQLPLWPLLRAQLIEQHDIIIDAKSGVSGAGREQKLSSLYCEVTEGMHPYGVASHRHTPEIEQGLSEALGAPVQVSFTPHLVPQSRGMLASIYVRTKPDRSALELHQALEHFYEHSPFVQLLPFGSVPQTRHVRGSNLAQIGVVADRLPGRVILFCAIDNLVKGASGQAVQNFNLMYGFAPTTALANLPLFP